LYSSAQGREPKRSCPTAPRWSADAAEGPPAQEQVSSRLSPALEGGFFGVVGRRNSEQKHCPLLDRHDDAAFDRAHGSLQNVTLRGCAGCGSGEVIRHREFPSATERYALPVLR